MTTFRSLLAILLFPFHFISNAQESPAKPRRFSAGVNFSGNHCYRTLSSSPEYQPLINARGEFEEPSFGFNTGVAIRYEVDYDFEIESGFQFSRQSLMFRSIPLLDNTGNTTAGYAHIKWRIHYYEIPLRFNYIIIKGKFFGYVSFGFSMNSYIDEETEFSVYYYSGEKVEFTMETESYGINKTTFAMIAGVGAGVNLSKTINIRLEPLYRYSLTPLTDSPINQHNYSIGLQTGIYFKF